MNGSKHGVPEYGHGVVAFPNYLAMTASQTSSSVYYRNCLNVKLERQVGSRQCRKSAISEGCRY